MGKHGPTAKLWPSVLGVVAVALVVVAVVLLWLWDPQWVPKG